MRTLWSQVSLTENKRFQNRYAFSAIRLLRPCNFFQSKSLKWQSYNRTLRVLYTVRGKAVPKISANRDSAAKKQLSLFSYLHLLPHGVEWCVREFNTTVVYIPTKCAVDILNSFAEKTDRPMSTITQSLQTALHRTPLAWCGFARFRINLRVAVPFAVGLMNCLEFMRGSASPAPPI